MESTKSRYVSQTDGPSQTEESTTAEESMTAEGSTTVEESTTTEASTSSSTAASQTIGAYTIGEPSESSPSSSVSQTIGTYTIGSPSPSSLTETPTSSSTVASTETSTTTDVPTTTENTTTLESTTTSESATTTSDEPEPEPEPEPEQECYGLDDRYYVTRRTLSGIIRDEFCPHAEDQGGLDENSASISKIYLEGTMEEVELAMDWEPGLDFVPDYDDCVRFLEGMALDGCDGDSKKNPMNWKGGGKVTYDDVTYRLDPQTLRQPYGTSKWEGAIQLGPGPLTKSGSGALDGLMMTSAMHCMMNFKGVPLWVIIGNLIIG